MIKRLKVGAITLHDSLLNPSAGTGFVAVQLCQTVESEEEVTVIDEETKSPKIVTEKREYAMDGGTEDGKLSDEDIVADARALSAKIAQRLADRRKVSVRASMNLTAPTVEPKTE
jgi:hypothetical protein